eukprot:15471284-Alexandrium_andersonii.AAC.1
MQTRWIHADAMPMPWLFLLALFEDAGHRVTPAGTIYPDCAAVPVTVQSLLSVFVQEFMRVVRAHMHAEHSRLFVRGSAGPHALNALGVFGTLSHVSVWPMVDELTYARVATIVLSMRAKLPTDWNDRLRDHVLVLPKTQLSLKLSLIHI